MLAQRLTISRVPLGAGDADASALRAVDQPLALGQAVGFDLRERAAQMFEKGVGHGGLLGLSEFSIWSVMTMRSGPCCHSREAEIQGTAAYF